MQGPFLEGTGGVPGPTSWFPQKKQSPSTGLQWGRGKERKPEEAHAYTGEETPVMS